MDPSLETIKDFANKAHGDQKRRYTPDKYVVHPIRVMELCKEYTNDVTVLAAALLHDVLEDTAVDKNAMLQFLMTVMDEKNVRRTLALVIELTDVYIKADYPSWNRRKRKEAETVRLERAGREAQTIKYADIIDNIRELPQDDDFSIVFLKECKSLLKRMNKGNLELYQKAVEEIEQKIKQFSKH
jgi:(p)ppGpp synthase/HD superfamily hydrolase